ncbi:secretin N-terminal domain-containing protein [Parerythrobacter aestuarii]|uniref:secretin N-terminal domain-containing protein n=1 Tax=Parerythrobacter aestuarii TaxID=3020909 RepID=UPI0024DEEB3D|nr:secretin N-terminal domain-containing protein [Parerythrobacter aestuarii]
MALLLATVACAFPARAQDGATTLTDVQLIAESQDQTIVRLRFSPAVATFSDVSEDGVAAVQLADTRRAQGAALNRQLKGLVTEVSFSQDSDGLTVRFRSRNPAILETRTSGETNLLVTIRRPRPGESIRSGERVKGEGFAYGQEGDLPEFRDPAPGEDGFALIELKYADVSEVVGLLSDGASVKPNDAFIRSEPGFGSPGTNGTNYGNVVRPQEEEELPLGQKVNSSLGIDRRLNAIWVEGSPERIARVRRMIALIDRPVDSVILETQFVELTETGARNVGFDFTDGNGRVGFGTIQSGQFLDFGFSPEATVESFSLQAAVYAQVQKGEGRIVSAPRIAAQSGTTAKITTGDALPILTSIQLSGVNGVSQQVQYVNVGVTLQIAPRVNSDGFITSKIYGVVSSVTGFSQGFPTISQREAETSATVRDGETFVIGGLTQEARLISKSKVPILGDIPLIGELFKRENSTDSNTELYIIITPHIIRHGDSAKLREVLRREADGESSLESPKGQ